MSLPEPEVNRLFAATIARSRHLRTRRRLLLGGAALLLIAAIAIPLLKRSAHEQTQVVTHPAVSTTTLRSSRPCPTAPSTRCLGPKPSSTLPGPSSPPELTVTVYLAALNAHNASLAEKLLEPSWRKQVESEQDSMLSNVVSITNVRITDVTAFSVGPGSPPGSAQGLPHGYPYATHVGVTFDLQQKRSMSMMNGETIWGYTLVRRSSDSRWLIAAEGVA